MNIFDYILSFLTMVLALNILTGVILLSAYYLHSKNNK